MLKTWFKGYFAIFAKKFKESPVISSIVIGVPVLIAISMALIFCFLMVTTVSLMIFNPKELKEIEASQAAEAKTSSISTKAQSKLSTRSSKSQSKQSVSSSSRSSSSSKKDISSTATKSSSEKATSSLVTKNSSSSQTSSLSQSKPQEGSIPSNSSSKNSTSKWLTACGNIYTGVGIYYGSGDVRQYVGIVIASNNNYVLIGTTDGSIKQIDRINIITDSNWSVKSDDPDLLQNQLKNTK